MQRIILFGDSITAGATHGYPTSIFTDKLRQKLAPTQAEIMNRGVLGDNTQGGLARLQTDVLAHKPDLVVIFFGTNDVQVPKMTLQQYQNNLEIMLEKIGAAKSILITPGITGPTRQGHRPIEKLQQYALATIETAKDKQADYIDWFAEAVKHSAAELLQEDDLHYAPRAYDLLLTQLAPVILQKLQ